MKKEAVWSWHSLFNHEEYAQDIQFMVSVNRSWADTEVVYWWQCYGGISSCETESIQIYTRGLNLKRGRLFWLNVGSVGALLILWVGICQNTLPVLDCIIIALHSNCCSLFFFFINSHELSFFLSLFVNALVLDLQLVLLASAGLRSVFICLWESFLYTSSYRTNTFFVNNI